MGRCISADIRMCTNLYYRGRNTLQYRKGNANMLDELKNRPILSAFDAIRYGYGAVKNNIMALLYILLIIYFPINLLSGYVAIASGNLEATLDLSAILSDPTLLENFITSTEYMRMALYNFMLMAIEAALAPFGAMAVVYISKEWYSGNTPTYGQALSAAFSGGWRFILSMIVFWVCVSLATLFMVIPGIILAVFWYFYVEAIIIDNCTGIKSLGRSRELVKGRWFKTLMYMIVFYCFSYLANYVVSMLFMWDSGTYLVTVIAGLLVSFISMIFTAAKTAVYINYTGNMNTLKNTEQ